MGQNRQSGLRCDRGSARGLCPGLECHSLSNLIKVYGIDGVNSHDALDDALACADVFLNCWNDHILTT